MLLTRRRDRMNIAPEQQSPAKKRYPRAAPPSGTDTAMNSWATQALFPAAHNVTGLEPGTSGEITSRLYPPGGGPVTLAYAVPLGGPSAFVQPQPYDPKMSAQ